MANQLTVKKQIEDWRQSVHDRIDNLCAIYKCADIKAAASIIMAADSSVMTLFHIVTSMAAETETEVSDKLDEMVTDSLTHIAMCSIELLCIPEERKSDLIDDILRIVRTRHELEDRLNGN